MTSAIPELYAALRPRPARPAIDWRSVRTIAALTLAGAALIVTGLTERAFGAPGLGWGMIGVGVVVAVMAAQVRW
jgi:hypothetical protein